MKCLVLGGGGFLGSHLCDKLLSEGHKVRVFERPWPGGETHSLDLPGLEWHEGDFTNAQDVEAALAGAEVIYHLVCTTLPKSSNDNPVYDIETNLVPTLRLLELLRRKPVRKLIFVSSGGTVYGVPREIPIRETHLTEPLCSYGIEKLAIEKYLHLYHVLHGLDYCVLRIGNPYGERQRPTGAQGAVAVFMRKAIEDQPIEIWGDGSVVRDYLYVGDAARALSLAKSNTSEHRVFNIGAGEGRSLNELVENLEVLAGRKVKRRYVAARSFDVPVNILDIARAREHLRWAPQVSFAEGLRRTWDWLKKNGEEKDMSIPFRKVAG